MTVPHNVLSTLRIGLFIPMIVMGCQTESVPDSRVASERSEPITLRRGETEIIIQLPTMEDGYHRDTRFDTSGLVSKVKVGKTNYLGSIWACPDPTLHGPQFGLAGEFTEPLGYEQAAVDETFTKIGVGILKRLNDNPYKFWSRFELVEPGGWEITQSDNSVHFVQELSGPHGYAYRYRKTITLLRQAELELSYEVTNVGEKPFSTRYYCHNFFRIKGKPTGPIYRLRVGFDITGGEPLPPADEARFEGDMVILKKPRLPKEALYCQLQGFSNTAASNRFQLQLGEDGPAVRVKGNRPLDGLTIYAHPNSYSVEPFISIDLAPGERMSWDYHYTFLTGNPDGTWKRNSKK